MISPQRRLSDFPGRPGRSTSRGRQCLLLDGLQIVVQRHLLSDQAFDGDHLDNLILGPHGKLALLCPYLQQDRPPSQLWAKVIGRSPGLHPRSRLGPHAADTFSDRASPATHPGSHAREERVRRARSEKPPAEGHCHRLALDGDVHSCRAGEMPR